MISLQLGTGGRVRGLFNLIGQETTLTQEEGTMKRLGIYALVLMVGAGFMAMGACGGGGGGGGDGLPRSSAAYAGSSHPAIISSTDGWDIGSLS